MKDIPQDVLLQMIGELQIIEQRNRAMNDFVAKMIRYMNSKNVFVTLVKGQGIAQCYEKPLWRQSGDIDLLLSKGDYERARHELKNIAASIEKENKSHKHQSMNIDGWTVELHGTLHCGLWHKMDRRIDEIQDNIFYYGNVRIWNNSNCKIFLPGQDEDVVLVFCHILQHFFRKELG